MKKVIALIMSTVIATSTMVGCASKPNTNVKQNTASKKYNAAMVTDTGGISDQSFNQSSWEGLQQFAKKTGAKVSYLESRQESDYATNLDKLADGNNNLIWGVGFAMSDAVLNAAKANKDISYAIVDNSYGTKTPSNVTGVTFKAQESSFIVGYIAGKTTKTNRVGFVGGIKSPVIDQFQYGYEAGVLYAAKELGKTINVDVQYAESFSDASKGKAIAQKMFSSGDDIVFHASGGTGVGVIEAAKEAGKYAIGVDRDQSYLAPDNVLTSALKRVNIAVEKVSEDVMNGKKVGGKTYTYGLKEGAVGIPAVNKNLSPVVYEAAMKLEAKINSGAIVVPYDQNTYSKYNK